MELPCSLWLVRLAAGCLVSLVGAVTSAGAFEARALLSLSDADSVASSYADGLLKLQPGVRDTLAVITDMSGDNAPATVEAPNSVVSWPAVMDISPDGRHAYVVETKGAPPDGTEQVDSLYTALPPGRLLSTFDLNDLAAPTLISQIEIGANPQSVETSPDGSWLAIGLDDAPGSIALVRLVGGVPADVHVLEPQSQTTRMRTVHWSPMGDLLAATLNDEHVEFYRFALSDGDRPTLTAFGDRVDIDGHISHGVFANDGRHFVVADVAWGEGSLGALFNGNGRLISIAVGPQGDHAIVSEAEVGLSPEGIAKNPAGDLFAAVNMNRSYLPHTFPLTWWPGAHHSSLSLVGFDQATGTLETLGEEVDFAGLLPENPEFDNTGRSLAVAVYHYADEMPTEGAVELWRVEGDGHGRHLTYSGVTITVPRGAHDLVRIP